MTAFLPAIAPSFQPQQYDSVKQLRYGHLMIMTDQDHDGSHIKGLIMNFFHHFYPSLLKLPGFLVEFITPIIKATRNSKTLAFYTLPEYEAWRESLGGSTRGWKVKYYKGTQAGMILIMYCVLVPKGWCFVCIWGRCFVCIWGQCFGCLFMCIGWVLMELALCWYTIDAAVCCDWLV